MTYSEFLKRFPTNDACLDYLKDRFYPDGSDCPGCGKATKFHRVRSRASYSCQYCRKQVYPTAGTIFSKTTTNLQLWFYAIFLMSSTRCGISAKQLERETGVTYPTALRMFRQIRSLLEQDHEPMSGTVEVDEVYLGGKAKWKHQIRGYRWDHTKTMVLGMAERREGTAKLAVSVVDPAKDGRTLAHRVTAKVMPASSVFTDEHIAYATLRAGYDHRRVNHQAKVYVSGDAHTNTIEGFWSLLRRGIGGVYHSVSQTYLQTYIDEYVWRYNHRDDARPMFWTVLDQVRKPDAPVA